MSFIGPNVDTSQNNRRQNNPLSEMSAFLENATTIALYSPLRLILGCTLQVHIRIIVNVGRLFYLFKLFSLVT